MLAFADESARRTYLVAAVLIAPAQLDTARRVLRELRMPGQRRVHFAKESPPRRRTVLSALLGTDLCVRIYECAGPDVPARARCLQRLVDDLVGVRASRLVLETLDSQLRADRATIGQRLEKHGRHQPLVFEHRRAYEEPLLWAADALAWSYGAGGEWRRRIGPLLDAAVRLDP